MSSMLIKLSARSRLLLKASLRTYLPSLPLFLSPYLPTYLLPTFLILFLLMHAC